MDSWSRVNDTCDGNEAVRPGTKDIYVQLVISLALGLSAFVAFCVRPKPNAFEAIRPPFPKLGAMLTT